MPLKTYTVTISGREREDGFGAYTWVVTAKDEANAIFKAKQIHYTDAGAEYEEMQVEEIFEGPPPADCNYFWNDRRER